MNNKYVIANLKMNMDLNDTIQYLKIANKEINSKNVIICPTSIYIPYFLKQNYSVGVQNIYTCDKGAFTGEISPFQASSIGINYAIIGHSERRGYLKETDDFINQKIKAALKNNLKVILCVGETLEEKEMFRTEQVLKRQITYGLKDLTAEELKNVLIAYEPIWSISTSGTGKVPNNKDISDVSIYIKGLINSNFKYADTKILYGGSVNDKNISTLNEIKEIDGVLVGGASCDINKLLKIIEVVVDQ